MNRIFNISIRDKIAKNLSKTFYVCDNSDYAARFDFDEEWAEHPFKTARFIGGDGTPIDVIFSGNECGVPVFKDTYQIAVGVFAGNLHTTTPAIIPAKRSILSGGKAPAVPPEDDYAKMMEEINAAAKRAEQAAEGKLDKSGHKPNMYLGTDENGNVVERSAPEGGGGSIVTETDPTVPEWAKQPEKPTYTAQEVGALPSTYTPPNQTAEQVGADPAGKAVEVVGMHNVDPESHQDIRVYLRQLADRINAVLDSDDATLDELSEIVAYIKSNKALIDAITTSKVNVADIVNNLVTSVADRPLSAAQGVALKELIDAISVPTQLSQLAGDASHRLVTDEEKTAWNAKSDFSGSYNDLDDIPVIPPAPVQSVNGQTGAVNLTASDVGALPANTKIPSATSDLTNSSGFITNAVSDLVNYYQKSETYTRDEINQLISAIPKFSISVVSELPAGNISETTIYLVGGGEGSDLYTEYIFANGAWEILGSQRVDLTGYATETWVIGHLAGYQPKGDYALKSEISTVPDYVKTEADAVIIRTLDAQTSGRVFTLAAISDMHYGSGGYTDGVKHAAQGIRHIAERIHLDALAATGDYTDLYIATDYANGIADVQAVNALLSGIDAETMALVGNHDFHAADSPQIARALLWQSENVVWGSKTGGYYYRDFDDYKLRVIALNTSETGNSNISCSTAQYNWFVSVLDMSAKEDATEWQILILSHHPLDWHENADDGVWRFANILNAYIEGKGWSGGGISCNFAGKNTARIICNVHGHLHNLKVDKIHLGNANTSTATIDVYRMCLPESCLDRPQSYGGVWETETTYGKTANTADDTSLTVLCIDLDNYKINAVNYGAGIDRSLVYYDPAAPKYTNLIPLSVDSDGKPFNGGLGWIGGYRLNSSGAQAENADYCVTGFIPVKDRDILYLKHLNFIVDDTSTQPNTRLATYTSSFALKRIMLSGEIPSSALFNAMLLDEDGGTLETGDAIGRLRLDTYDADTAYIRFSTKKIDATSIVTVNEPIV